MIRVLVAGLGQMGRAHALAYHHNNAFEIVGLINRSAPNLPEALSGYPLYEDFYEALAALKPDLASINTYTDSHAEYAIAAMTAGAHVFVEKPLAVTLADAQAVVEAAARFGRKLVVGYILRHHPGWERFIAEAQRLGPPFVFRLNLNQQSEGAAWALHKRLMEDASPIVDCGVHYVDVMRQICGARPVRVHGIGARLTDEIDPAMYNFGHLHVTFADGSVGWYEAGWGPMISETAYFVKDVISPAGAVSMVSGHAGASSDLEGHTSAEKLRLRRPGAPDAWIDLPADLDHQALCAREQAFVAEAIRNDLDLTRHHQDALWSLAICLAADASICEGRAIDLSEALDGVA